MKVRIYQINLDRDACRLAWADSSMFRKWGIELSALPADRYDITAQGELPEAETLEDVYRALNRGPDPIPEWYKARSLSVSDVVEVLDGPVEPGLYFCDTFGFKPCVWWETPRIVRFTGPDGYLAPCELLPELPEPGEKWHGFRIDTVTPAPVTAPQPETSADIYTYSVWRLNFSMSDAGPIYAFVAVHESEQEQI